ncbi:MAG: hypothetical protein ACRCXZ_06965 [Patescibacteria group bacterium]
MLFVGCISGVASALIVGGLTYSEFNNDPSKADAGEIAISLGVGIVSGAVGFIGGAIAVSGED